jgi:[ribosomal protein S18]-alanine N-acetyltransferase
MIRPMRLGDVDRILAIQKESPELPQWTRRDYEQVAAGSMAGWVAEEQGAVIGFIVARKLADEMEILSLAVAPESRRQHRGSELLAGAIEWGHANSIQRAFLEVGASNLAAIAFYESHRFTSVGRRPNYYVSPLEDAIILAATLSANVP